MIASWMGYSALLGVFTGLAAFALEYALRLNRKPARALWALAMGTTLVVPAALAWVGTRPAQTSTSAAARESDGLATLLSLNEWVVTPTPFLERLDAPLLFVWVAASMVAAFVLAGGIVRLRVRRRRWAANLVEDTAVLVSEDFGPALVGLAKPQIVLPKWALDLPSSERALVIAHEAEHRATRDTQLLASGAFAALLMPWNLPLLWHLRRLRRAVELDCDARLLRRGVSPIVYGELLLRMGTNRGPSVPFAATLTEPRTLLEKRIQMIAQRETQGRVKKTMMALALAAVVIAVACDTPAPTQISERPQASRVEVADGVPSEATVEVRGGDEQVQPLIIVDGVITKRTITELNALNIERIEVIKGKAAEGLYGARAAGGVIQVTTRPGTAEAEIMPLLLEQLEQRNDKTRQ